MRGVGGGLLFEVVVVSHIALWGLTDMAYHIQDLMILISCGRWAKALVMAQAHIVRALPALMSKT